MNNEEVRRRLVELVEASLFRHIDKSCLLSENIVNDLLKNGVTIRERGEWIPVTERLPEKDGEYLALAKIGKLNLPIILCFAKDGRKIDEHDFEDMWENVWYEYDCEWGFVTKDFTTHWMPLPEPPEAEKGDV